LIDWPLCPRQPNRLLVSPTCLHNIRANTARAEGISTDSRTAPIRPSAGTATGRATIVKDVSTNTRRRISLVRRNTGTELSVDGRMARARNRYVRRLGDPTVGAIGTPTMIGDAMAEITSVAETAIETVQPTTHAGISAGLLRGAVANV
jgi:hypothetical protein